MRKTKYAPSSFNRPPFRIGNFQCNMNRDHKYEMQGSTKEKFYAGNQAPQQAQVYIKPEKCQQDQIRLISFKLW